MKRVLILTVIALLISCNSSSDFRLTGTIANAEDGEMICLSYPAKRGEIWYKQCDTAYLDNGKFQFRGYVDGVVPAEITFRNLDCAQLYLEPSRLKFRAERSALYDYTLSGLSIGDDLKQYRQAFAEYEKAVYEKNHEVLLKNCDWLAATEADLDSADDLLAQFYEMVAEHRAMNNRWQKMAIEFVKSHPNSALVPNIIDRLISYGCDEQTIEPLINALTVDQQQGTLGSLMAVRHEISKLNGGKVGSKALDFTLSTINGGSVTLSECYQKGYVLLDFWASWCVPCIYEIPKLREIYQLYGDKLQILSISADEDIVEWHKAVSQHNLTQWQQLIAQRASDADNYYFPEQVDITLAYDIELIPCFILIDSNGNIVGRWSHITPETKAEIAQIIQQ